MSTEQNVSDELEPLDPSFFDDYQAAASEQTQLPPDGAYQVKLPDTISDSNFRVKQDKKTQKNYLDISLDLTIVGGEHDGYVARFINCDTRQIPEFKKQGDAWVQTGKLFNASDAYDLLQNFNSSVVTDPETGKRSIVTGDVPRPASKSDWEQAVRSLAGRVSPFPVYLTWAGYDKGGVGKTKYLKSKDFPTIQGERKNFVERTAQVAFSQKIRGEVKQVNVGDKTRVYANLRLSQRGYAPKLRD